LALSVVSRKRAEIGHGAVHEARGVPPPRRRALSKVGKHGFGPSR